MPISFKDLAVRFSEEEWRLLEEGQREFYRDVMRENYETLVSVGKTPAPRVSWHLRPPDLCLLIWEVGGLGCSESLGAGLRLAFTCAPLLSCSVYCYGILGAILWGLCCSLNLGGHTGMREHANCSIWPL